MRVLEYELTKAGVPTLAGRVTLAVAATRGLPALLGRAVPHADTVAVAPVDYLALTAADPTSLPRYRRVSAPIYGVAMKLGSAVYQKIDSTDLPQSHRAEIARRDEALGLGQGAAVLERAVQIDRQFAGNPDPVLPSR